MYINIVQSYTCIQKPKTFMCIYICTHTYVHTQIRTYMHALHCIALHCMRTYSACSGIFYAATKAVVESS